MPGSSAPRAVLPSLRLWLQSTSLLAVLAGYALLLVLNQAVAVLQRAKAHQELVAQLLVAAVLPPQQPIPGLQVDVLPGRRLQTPQLLHQSGRSWLVSITPLSKGGVSSQSLLVAQNVTASVQREWLSQMLLIVAAGVSALLTAALLRPVLRRGLVQPLEELGAQLDALQAPPAPPVALAEAGQPTELRPIAAAFNAMQQRLAVSWEQQRAFVDAVAHELRTPLTLISGHAQSLQRHAAVAASSDAAAALQLMAAEAHRMGLLVSDLLDLARQDAGRLEVRLQPLDPEEALLTCFERLQRSSAGRLQLVAGERSLSMPMAWADPDRLQQCLAALIDNALRYTPATVELHVSSSGGQVVLLVRDHGPGVPLDERERIFERFVRGSAAAETRGSGIGLSIVRLLMEAMGGTVHVLPAPGGGADFELRLRRA